MMLKTLHFQGLENGESNALFFFGRVQHQLPALQTERQRLLDIVSAAALSSLTAKCKVCQLHLPLALCVKHA